MWRSHGTGENSSPSSFSFFLRLCWCCKSHEKMQHAHVRNGFLTALTSLTVINTHSTNNPAFSHKYRVKSKNQGDLIIGNSLLILYLYYNSNKNEWIWLTVRPLSQCKDILQRQLTQVVYEVDLNLKHVNGSSQYSKHMNWGETWHFSYR